jgi:hypothetical protein
MSERWISLPELEDVIGKAEADALCRAFGGLSKYLPRKPGADHPFARIIGMRALDALASFAGGWHLALPNLRRPEAEKNRILDMLEDGRTHREIAEECKVSERWVRHLAARRRETQGQKPLPISMSYNKSC